MNSKCYYFIVLLFSFYFLRSSVNVSCSIDSGVGEYITSIIEEKNRCLQDEGKSRISTLIKIIRCPVQRDSEGLRACVVKFRRYVYLELSSGLIDFIKLFLDTPTEQYFCLSYVIPNSEYHLKFFLSRSCTEGIVRFIIEHELGHIFYKDHGLFYRPYTLFKIFSKTFAFWGVCYYAYQKSIENNTSFKWLKKLSSIVSALGGYGYFVNSHLYELVRGTSVPAYKWAEQQADDFVSSNEEVLYGGIVFNTIHFYEQIFHGPKNKLISLLARLYGLTPEKYIIKYPHFTYRLMEKYTPCQAIHPSPTARINKLKERLNELSLSDNQKKYAVIALCKNHTDEIIKHITI